MLQLTWQRYRDAGHAFHQRGQHQRIVEKPPTSCHASQTCVGGDARGLTQRARVERGSQDNAGLNGLGVRPRRLIRGVTPSSGCGVAPL